MTKQDWIVKLEEMGTLVHFLLKKFGTAVSQRQVRRALDEAQCTVNGRAERFANTKLRPGDRVVFKGNITQFAVKEVKLFELSRVLYEDEYFLAYDKPSGVTTDREGILTALSSYCNHLKIVHRLDRLTSGVLILAKTKEAEEKLAHHFKTREISKVYLAVVDGVPKSNFGVIKNTIAKKGSYGYGQTLYEVAPEGKLAITKWKVKKRAEDYSIIQCRPITGRTHQLRVHLSWMGHPILGDNQYATERFKTKREFNRMMLHAWKIEFDHPFTGEKVSIESKVPPEFEF